MIDEEKLYEEGRDSFRKDRYLPNPYPKESEEYRAWYEGWIHTYECSH